MNELIQRLEALIAQRRQSLLRSGGRYSMERTRQEGMVDGLVVALNLANEVAADG